MPGGLDIERLYDEHAQSLYAFLLNFTRAEADTRDLLQEIFVKLAREPKLLAGVREERAFLIRLAHASEQLRFAGEFDENFLKQIARVGLGAREIQKKSIKRLRVLIVEPFDVQSD